MGSPNSHPAEEQLKQTDSSDKVKQMPVPHRLLGPDLIANGFLPGGPGSPQGHAALPPLDLGDLCQVPMEALGALVGQWSMSPGSPNPSLGAVQSLLG